jgi:hypothetical protein
MFPIADVRPYRSARNNATGEISLPGPDSARCWTCGNNNGTCLTGGLPHDYYVAGMHGASGRSPIRRSSRRCHVVPHDARGWGWGRRCHSIKEIDLSNPPEWKLTCGRLQPDAFLIFIRRLIRKNPNQRVAADDSPSLSPPPPPPPLPSPAQFSIPLRPGREPVGAEESGGGIFNCTREPVTASFEFDGLIQVLASGRKLISPSPLPPPTSLNPRPSAREGPFVFAPSQQNPERRGETGSRTPARPDGPPPPSPPPGSYVPGT